MDTQVLTDNSKAQDEVFLKAIRLKTLQVANVCSPMCVQPVNLVCHVQQTVGTAFCVLGTVRKFVCVCRNSGRRFKFWDR